MKLDENMNIQNLAEEDILLTTSVDPLRVFVLFSQGRA